MSKNYNTIIVCGSIAYDEIMDFPGKFVDYLDSSKLHQINVSFVVDRLQKQLGGIATNIAYNIRLLSRKKVGIVSAIGKDGQAFIDFFKKFRINSAKILLDKTSFTATGKVITDRADNQIWGYFYGPLRQAKKINLVKIGADKATLFVLVPTHQEAFLKHQSDLISNKCDYVYDPGMALTWIKNEDLVDGVFNSKWLIGNDYEIAQVIRRCDISKETMIKKGIAIITTLGEKGVVFESITDKYHLPAYKIKKTVDPTGAGDAWRGGFIAGIVENKSIEASLIQANALASFAVEKYGTVNHRPTKRQIHDRIKSIASHIYRKK